MRAAAKFHAHALVLAEADHAHHVAVLLAEERHRAFGHGPLVGGPAGVHRVIGQDDGVGVALDVGELVRSQRLVVGEIEAQTFGRDQ